MTRYAVALPTSPKQTARPGIVPEGADTVR